MTAISGTKRIAIIGLAVAAALAIAPGAAAAPAVTLTALARVDDSPTTYYLSLGDSLAQGFQPNGDLTHGYAEQFYASLAADQPKLRLVKLGCGGESTVSMRFGSQDPTVVGSCGTPRYYKVLFPKGTQLAEAVSFLQAHKGKVALVTIGIGANDLSWRDAQGNDVFCLLEPDGCARRTAVMAENLAAILADLRAAAGPDVPIVGMSYYDVFAPLCVSDPSLLFVCSRVDAFNAILVDTYGAAGDPVADVAGAFENDNLANTAAHVCAWTWFCVLGDLHANTAGYGVIAQAFEQALP
jgi:lysophospholipase L1-like esterase